LAQVSAGEPTRLVRYPDISRDQVVFVYAADLWTAPAEGVDPDVVVEQRPDLEARGRDPQLEKAIELALEGLKSMPAPLSKPPYPIKALRRTAPAKKYGD
jgi:tricorn protease